MKTHIQNTIILILFLTITVSCTNPKAATPTPTLLPYPDALDLALVHDEVSARINNARVAQGMEPMLWDETLQGLAEGRAWGIVTGVTSLDDGIDGAVAGQLGEPVAELWACISDSVTSPAAVAEVAVEPWLDDPELREMLLGTSWERIGVGYD